MTLESWVSNSFRLYLGPESFRKVAKSLASPTRFLDVITLLHNKLSKCLRCLRLRLTSRELLPCSQKQLNAKERNNHNEAVAISGRLASSGEAAWEPNALVESLSHFAFRASPLHRFFPMGGAC